MSESPSSIWSRRTMEKRSFLAAAGVRVGTEGSNGHKTVEGETDKVDKTDKTDKGSESSSTVGTNTLERSWTVWYLHRGPGVKISNYLDATEKVAEFSTAEEFFQVYSHLRRLDKLSFTSQFQLFPKGVKPMWEDPVNVDGGQWQFRMPRPSKEKRREEAARPTKDRLREEPGSDPFRVRTSEVWEKLVLALVGGTLGGGDTGLPDDEIVGIVVSVRRYDDSISVWNRSGKNKAVVERIRKVLEGVINADSQLHAHTMYKVHSTSIKEGSQRQVGSYQPFQLGLVGGPSGHGHETGQVHGHGHGLHQGREHHRRPGHPHPHPHGSTHSSTHPHTSAIQL